MKKQVSYLQKLFYDIWNDFGSVYLVVHYSGRTRIGKRGFTDEEKTRGLVLVFNNKTNADLNWDAEGNLSCVLAFGARKEDVHIHHDDLRGLFSPEAKVQFLRNDGDDDVSAGPGPAPAGEETAPDKQHVISIDKFRKKRTGRKE